MKVVHVGQWHKADDSRIFHKECCSLAKAGYDVTYYTSDRSGGKVGVSEVEGVKIHIYPYRQKVQNKKGIIKLLQILYNRISRPILLYTNIVKSKPDIVHILYKGRIVKSGGPELALELEERGYDWIKEEMGE